MSLRHQLGDHPLLGAILVYMVIAIPGYFWFVGPTGAGESVDSSIAFGGMLGLSILVVPTVQNILKKRFYNPKKRLGFEN